MTDTQVALITGAGSYVLPSSFLSLSLIPIPLPPSGIGLESSLLFASEGAHVLLVDLNLPSAERVAALISERYPNVQVEAAKADVGKEEEVKAAVGVAVETWGRLDVMVSSEGY